MDRRTLLSTLITSVAAAARREVPEVRESPEVAGVGLHSADPGEIVACEFPGAIYHSEVRALRHITQGQAVYWGRDCEPLT